MADDDHIDTHHKALTVKLDPNVVGSFAEIGAGQEVARWFLRVGAASGTVAKTISAQSQRLEGRMLEAISRLCGHSVRVYTFPMAETALEDRLRALSGAGWAIDAKGGWVTADRLLPGPPLGHLYSYLLAGGFVEPMRRAAT